MRRGGSKLWRTASGCVALALLGTAALISKRSTPESPVVEASEAAGLPRAIVDDCVGEHPSLVDETYAPARGPLGAPAQAAPQRAQVVASAPERAEIAPAIAALLRRHRENPEDYERYAMQEEETASIIGELSCYRLHEALRPARFDIQRFVDESLRVRFAMDDETRGTVLEILTPVCCGLVEDQRATWIARDLARVGDVSFAERARVDLARRAAWLELEAAHGARIRAADAELGRWLRSAGPVIGR